MINNRFSKFIIIGMILIFAGLLFLSVRFIKGQLTSAISPLKDNNTNTSAILNVEAWGKIKDRFK